MASPVDAAQSHSKMSVFMRRGAGPLSARRGVRNDGNSELVCYVCADEALRAAGGGSAAAEAAAVAAAAAAAARAAAAEQAAADALAQLEALRLAAERCARF